MPAKTKVILPNKLEAGAVIPQCLDNQFVPDEIFRYMVDNCVPYSDPYVQNSRINATRTELNRSLLYAPQTIINRAFFWNNRVLYSTFKNIRENQSNRKAFINLLEDQSIVPYLHDKSKITDEPDFDLDEEGVKTFKSLLRDVKEIECIRFDIKENKNNRGIEIMKQLFFDYFSGFYGRSESLIRQTADGLLPGRDSIERSRKVDALTKEFIRWKPQLLDTVFNRFKSHGSVTRNMVYEDLLCRNDVLKPVTNGFFLSNQKCPFVLEKKKLFDLRYNTNLADCLKRYVFTPADMPMRSSLAIDVDLGTGKGDEMLELLGTNIRHTLFEGMQNSLNLPLLKDLEIEDIFELRQLPGWADYIVAQRQILVDPLNSLQYLDNFKNALGIYHSQISEWYIRNKRNPQLEKKYNYLVRIAVKIAGAVIAYNLTNDTLVSAVAALSDLPDNALGYTVSLLVDFIPEGSFEVDRQLGYSLDIVNYEANVSRESIKRLIAKAMEASSKAYPSIYKDLANQSRN